MPRSVTIINKRCLKSIRIQSLFGLYIPEFGLNKERYSVSHYKTIQKLNFVPTIFNRIHEPNEASLVKIVSPSLLHILRK